MAQTTGRVCRHLTKWWRRPWKTLQRRSTSEVKPHDNQDVIGTFPALKTHDDLNRIVAKIMAATEQIAAGSSQVSSSSQLF
ncbi:MAG: hypothetical protein U5J62_05650 [Desulfurivibrio sp.]|nr:hypothetical protein [Desulfurivibrio sp.]